MGGSSSALALAAWLRALDDGALTSLLRERSVRAAGIRDSFDLAEALLDPAGVQAALAHLDRVALGVLAASGALAERGDAPGLAAVAERMRLEPQQLQEPLETLRRRALLDETGDGIVPWGPVTDALLGWPAQGLPSRDALIDEPPPPTLETVTDDDRATIDRTAADRAFAAVVAIGELIAALGVDPARILQRGGVALPDWRRLLTATAASDDAELHTMLAVAEGAGLVAPEAGAWHATPSGRTWRELPRVDRWTALAESWLARVPGELREHIRLRAHSRWGEGLLDYLRWLFPAGGDWLTERAQAAVRSAELLGIVGGGAPSSPGSALLADGVDAAAHAVGELFPADVRQVYVQHDLSVIAPGPLAADIDARLRELAEVEAVGVATSYRITNPSLTRALTAGRSAAELRDFLAEISLTGIPQPLDYLISETAGRFGSLRVGPLSDALGTPEAGSRAYVQGDDPELVGQLVIDQSLVSLGLRRAGEHRAVSRFDAETVYWALVDARYPAVYEDADGRIRAVERTVTRAAAAVAGPDTAELLVARLREADSDRPEEGGAAWNARQLELAIKQRLEVTVTVRMPDGREVPYLLEPAALAGGRLRARDRRADIERTLPLSHIVDVTPSSP
ncbi:helicase-associated domain-containing protein [Homoserinibacter sp. GY 40078]|uniref:helicase-associated domain-containing protein n=1 Tax=Homoserinibacter sp. GY 40078 TaxID=2603275 RepID=UPI0011C8431A|nr:helicase-associated domain-containing protein [Homoserinibacter sp. GY 40078]TXK19364.1 hypothetical protein FVQ89_05505 [Homoserinibacter sp. GY 40078]